MLGKRPRPLLQSSFLLKGKCIAETGNTQVSGKHLHPASSVPRHVVLGFDIEHELKAFDACESPRSVLDVNAPALEKQGTARSLRSGLRALPLRKNGSQGVGLAIIVDIQAEERENSCVIPLGGQRAVTNHQRSQPIAIATDPYVRGRHAVRKANGHVDLSPIHSDNKSVDSEDSLLGFFASEEMSPWQESILHNQWSGKAEVDEAYVTRPPIFSVASVPCSHGSPDIGSLGFLDACAFCERSFLPGKDIYMYRGDQAFCSVECRGEQIKVDESKEKQVVMRSSPDHHALFGYTRGSPHNLGKMRGT